MAGKQYVEKNKTLTAQFVKRKQIINKISGVALVNKIATQRSLCNVYTFIKSLAF